MANIVVCFLSNEYGNSIDCINELAYAQKHLKWLNGDEHLIFVKIDESFDMSHQKNEHIAYMLSNKIYATMTEIGHVDATANSIAQLIKEKQKK